MAVSQSFNLVKSQIAILNLKTHSVDFFVADQKTLLVVLGELKACARVLSLLYSELFDLILARLDHDFIFVSQTTIVLLFCLPHW